MKKPDNEEHKITDREKRAWQTGKKRPARRRPSLTTAQRIEFLDLVARMAPASEFERKLNLTSGDVEFYSNELNVKSQQEARRMHRQMKHENKELIEAKAIAENKKVREAEATAQQRLDEIAARREAVRPVKKPDVLAIKTEDAERQRRLAEQQAKTDVPAKEWQLPVEGTEAQRHEQIDRFRRELLYHGFSFVRKKYNATNAQIKFEAQRLGLKINWEVVRR